MASRRTPPGVFSPVFGVPAAKIPPPSYYGTIRRVTPAGEVTTIAGSAIADGNQGGNDGAGTAARFNDLRGLAVDAMGTLYVADGTHTIRKVSAAGAVSTVAGVPNQVGFLSGPLPGVLQDPGGLAVRDTDLFIAMDTGIAVVRNRP